MSLTSMLQNIPKWFACTALLTGVTALTAQAADDAENWPHPRGGLDGSGVSQVELADQYESAWVYKTGGAVLASPVVMDGVVYVGSEDKHLHAIDAGTGQKKWAFAAATLIDASAVVDDGVLYIGTDGGVLHAIDAQSGKEKWKFETGGRITGQPGVTTIKDGGAEKKIVLIGSHDGKLYCLDASSGAQRWAYVTEDYINCGVCITGGKVVLGGCDTRLHVVDLKSGKGLAKVDLGGEVSGTPALAEGHAYLGHMQNEVVAVNLEDRKVAWRFHDRDFPFAGSPAVSGDTLLIGSQGRRLYALNRESGAKLWAIRTHGGVDGAPVIAGKRAVFGSSGGRLSMIDLTKGETVWQTDIGASIDSGPAVTASLLVVGAEDGGVYAFKPSKAADAANTANAE